LATATAPLLLLLPALALLADGLVADPNDAEEPRLMLRRPGFLGRRDRSVADGGGGRAEGIVTFLASEMNVSALIHLAKKPKRAKRK